jgi:hypothetical protein
MVKHNVGDAPQGGKNQVSGGGEKNRAHRVTRSPHGLILWAKAVGGRRAQAGGFIIRAGSFIVARVASRTPAVVGRVRIGGMNSVSRDGPIVMLIINPEVK